jgi:hypothetical protein
MMKPILIKKAQIIVTLSLDRGGPAFAGLSFLGETHGSFVRIATGITCTIGKIPAF